MAQENESKNGKIYTQEQVDGIMNDFKTNVLPQIKTAIEARQKKSTGVTLVTLSSAPTASTLQYTIGSGQNAKTYDFKIGDEVRVQDSENASEGANGYVFYKLHDITGSGNNKTAYWDLGASGGGGGGALGKVKVYLKDIINEVENLSPSFAGVVVTLTNTSDAGSTPVTKTLAAGEKSVVFTKVTPLKNYSVSVAQLDAQHTTPTAQTITNLAIGEEKELTFNYEADEYTVNIASNQGTDSAISAAKVTYNNTQYADGDKFKVAKGTTVSLTTSAMSDVTDYAKSISLSGKAINALYSTTLVAISVVSNQSDFTERKAYTINGTTKYVTATGTTPALTGTVKVATGTALTITAPDIEHYAKNVASYGNATGASQTIAVEYDATKVNLNMVGVVNGVEGSFPTGAQGTVKHTGGADQTLTDNTTTALVPTGSAFTIEYAGVSGYGTPATYSSTAAGTAMTASKASYVYGVLTIELTTSDNDDTDLAKAKVYITIGSGSEEEMTGSISSHVKTFSQSVVPGTTYSLRFGDVTGYATPAAMTNQTKASGAETIQKVYNTTLLSVALASDTGEADLTGVTVTVTDTTASATVSKSGNVYKIPTGHGYSVAVSGSVEGYTTPSAVTGTASGTTASVTLEYVYNPIMYAYITFNQTQSGDTAIVDVKDTASGSALTCPTTSGATHPNAAIEALRRASHLYMGKQTAAGKQLLCQLSDSDGAKYTDGTTAAFDGTEGDHWLRIGIDFYIKRVSGSDSGDTVTYGIAVGGQPDSTWKQLITPNDLLAVHEAYIASSKLYSRSGVQSGASQNRNTFKTYARNRNASGTASTEGYSCVTWEWSCVMALLFFAWYGRANCQAQCGTGANSYTRTLGAKNSLGMTDTTSSNGNADDVKFWGIENWWGDKYEWVDNVDVQDRVWTVKDLAGTSQRTGMTGGSSNGYITKLLLSENLDLIPTAASGGSDTTYYCDYYYQNTGSRVVARSHPDANTSGGVAYVSAYYDSSVAYGFIGSRLAFKGEIEIAQSVAAYKAASSVG